MAATEPRLRADAERNRRRLLDAAAEVLAEKGLACSVDEIARCAGVGHATAFRHFPTKEALVAAVAADRMGQLADAAEAALGSDDPERALREFLELGTAMHARDLCLIDAAALVVRSSEVLAQRQRVVDALARLLRLAQRAGAVRRDVTAEDLLVLMLGITKATGPFRTAAPEIWRRYLALVLDGLRPVAATKLPSPPPSSEQIAAAIRELAGD